jgi:hypothetical protein
LISISRNRKPFLKRFSKEDFRFSTVSCKGKSTKNPALSRGIQLAKIGSELFQFPHKINAG